jgi:hypothetical protein
MNLSFSKFTIGLLTCIANGALAVVLIMESLLITSLPLANHQKAKVDAAIAILESKGFDREVYVLKNFTLFRSSDNWLNAIAGQENAFAATNMPFGVMTLYPDFYSRTNDDTERAMILLHESRHMLGDNEDGAYGFVWKNRAKLGWTQLGHGTTETYTSVELLTRQFAPALFNCPDRLWSDCTEVRISGERK